MCHENYSLATECTRSTPHGVKLSREPIRCKKYCKQALAAHRKRFGHCYSSMSSDGRKLQYHPDEEEWLRHYGERHSCTDKVDRSGALVFERKLMWVRGPCTKCTPQTDRAPSLSQPTSSKQQRELPAPSASSTKASRSHQAGSGSSTCVPAQLTQAKGDVDVDPAAMQSLSLYGSQRPARSSRPSHSSCKYDSDCSGSCYSQSDSE